MHAPPARVRATSYITRMNASRRPELLVFAYSAKPNLGTHLPGGGIGPGERPDQAALREAIEETGVTRDLTLLGVVGVQQRPYDNGNPCVSLFFHLRADEPRDDWTHTMIGDPEAWDTGSNVRCRFRPLDEAAQLLRDSGYGQDEFVPLLFGHCRERRSTLAKGSRLNRTSGRTEPQT